MLGDIIKIAFMEIATDNIGGMTIHSVFDIGIKKIGEFDIPDNPETDLNKKLQKMINNLNLNNEKLLIIDKISQVALTLLQVINKQLQQIKNNELPFGGIPTILYSDFRQAPPIQEMSLANAVVQVNDIINNDNVSINSFLYQIISCANKIIKYTKSV